MMIEFEKTIEAALSIAWARALSDGGPVPVTFEPRFLSDKVQATLECVEGRQVLSFAGKVVHSMVHPLEYLAGMICTACRGEATRVAQKAVRAALDGAVIDTALGKAVIRGNKIAVSGFEWEVNPLLKPG